MRLSEYFDFVTRTDIGMAANPKPMDYYYFSPWTVHKRQRYLYQCKPKANGLLLFYSMDNT